MWDRYITEPLRGHTPLWKVIWIQGVGASVVYALLGTLLVPDTRRATAVYLLGGLLIGAVQSVMLWQCAYNGRSRAAGTLLRVVVLIGAVLMPLALYLWWTHPELADLDL